MKNVLKLARRLVLTLLCVFGLLPILNLVVLFSVTYGFQSNGRPYSTAEEVAAGLTKTADGYRLPEEIENRLKEEHVWAFFAGESAVAYRQSSGRDAADLYSFHGSRTDKGLLPGQPHFPGSSRWRACDYRISKADILETSLSRLGL